MPFRQVLRWVIISIFALALWLAYLYT